MEQFLNSLYKSIEQRVILHPDFTSVSVHTAVAVGISFLLSYLLRKHIKEPKNTKWKHIFRFIVSTFPVVVFLLYVLFSRALFGSVESALWRFLVNTTILALLWRIAVVSYKAWLEDTKFKWLSHRFLTVIKLSIVVLIVLNVIHLLHIPSVESKIVVISLKVVVVGLVTITLMRKERVMSVFPTQITLQSYQKLLFVLNRLYYPLISISLVVLLVWVLGYYAGFQKLFLQSWMVVALYVLFSYIHDLLLKWYKAKPDSYRGRVYDFTIYVLSILFVFAALSMVGLYDPLVKYGKMMIVFSAKNIRMSAYDIVRSVLLFIGVYRFAWFMREFIESKLSVVFKWPDTVKVPLSLFAFYLTVMLAILLALKALGIDLTALSIFAGALGVGVGIGLQDIARNMISGITVLLSKTLKIGDLLIIENHTGRVEKMDIRSVTIRTLDNIELIIPSQRFISSPVVNLTHSSPLMRVHIPFGVAYGSDPDKVREVVLKAVESYNFIERTPPPEVLFLEFGDNSLNFELVVWYNSRFREMKFLRSDINYIIHRALTENGIEIPFPQRDVHIRSGIPWGDIIEAIGRFKNTKNDKEVENGGELDKRD